MARKTSLPTPRRPPAPAQRSRSKVTGPPVEPSPSALGIARALLRAASTYVEALRPVLWGTPRWPAVEEARRAVGRACFRAVGEVVVYTTPEPQCEPLPGVEPAAAKSRAATPATGILKRWWGLEGNAEGATARDAVRAGQAAFFALRDAVGVELTVRRTRPLDVWATAALPGYAPGARASVGDDEYDRGYILEARLSALTGATNKRALRLAWELVLDDQWDERSAAELRAAHKATGDWLADRLRKRIEKAKTERALRGAWAAAKKAGRTAELEELLRASVTRLRLTDAQASKLAA